MCVIGKRSGALPPSKAAEPFGHMLPSGITRASYTQWEFFFARHFKRRLSIYIAKDDYQPDLPTPTDDDPELQRAFCDHIVKEQGLDRGYFANEDQLARAILKEDWPRKRTGKPIALPFPSLGGLFKGRDEFLKELHASLSRGSRRTAAARFMVLADRQNLDMRMPLPKGRQRKWRIMSCSKPPLLTLSYNNSSGQSIENDERMGSDGRLTMRRTITKSEQDAIRAKVLGGYTADADDPSLQYLAEHDEPITPANYLATLLVCYHPTWLLSWDQQTG